MSRCSDKWTECISGVIVSVAVVYVALNTSDKGGPWVLYFDFPRNYSTVIKQKKKYHAGTLHNAYRRPGVRKSFFRGHFKISEDLGGQKIDFSVI